MRLSNRLKLILGMLPSGLKLCDVGTDHALIPVAAIRKGLFPCALATDIRPGPLARAVETVNRHHLAEQVQTRLGPGLSPVHPGECDVIVIAGMGALMITGILEAHPDIARQATCLLLQPMHAQEKLRPWLRDNGYEVYDEQLAEEGAKRYQVLSVRPVPLEEGICACEPNAVNTEPRKGDASAVPVREMVTLQERKKGSIPDDADMRTRQLLYDCVGEGIVRRGGPIAVRWVEDWTRRQRRIAQGLRRSDDAGAGQAERLLTAMEDCLASLQARLREDEQV